MFNGNKNLFLVIVMLILLANLLWTNSDFSSANIKDNDLDGAASVTSQAPKQVLKSENLVAQTTGSSASPKTIAKGEALFSENCTVCHQADAIGKPGFAPSLTNQEFLSVSSDKFLMATIRDGREDTGMPPFSHLGRKDVRAIVAFLRSHAKRPNRSKEIDAEPNSQGDPRLGRLWYDQICSTCHGVSGNGYEAGGTGTAIGYPGFLNKVSDGFLRETIKQGRTNTRMLGFSGPAAMANLSDQEIDDIIVYLRQLAKKH